MTQIRLLPIVALLFLLFPLSSKAQSIFFDFNDGSSASYTIDEVRSTDFSGEDLRVFLWDGTSYSWNLEDIANYNFTGLSTVVEGQTTDALPQLSVFPNPSNGEVSISFRSEGSAEVSVQVYDTKGNLVRTVHKGKFSAGNQSVLWKGDDSSDQPVGNGTYVCRVVQGPRTASKQVVVVR